jgi:hypothetical protein
MDLMSLDLQYRTIWLLLLIAFSSNFDHLNVFKRPSVDNVKTVSPETSFAPPSLQNQVRILKEADGPIRAEAGVEHSIQLNPRREQRKSRIEESSEL